MNRFNKQDELLEQAEELKALALAWEPSVKLFGNITAKALAEIVTVYISTIKTYRVSSEEISQTDLIGMFNMLPDRLKWIKLHTVKFENVIWVCSKCGCESYDGPSKASPFQGMSRNCAHCLSQLTRRTNGGQTDPFGWIAKLKNKE